MMNLALYERTAGEIVCCEEFHGLNGQNQEEIEELHIRC